jgi:hypothetical protein
MIWIIALLCMGLGGLAGKGRGAIRAAFSLLGLLFGLALARPLSPLGGYLLPLLGLQNPLWRLFVPGAIAFLGVLAIFKIVGSILHQKAVTHYKYQRDEELYFRWERLYGSLGFCVGMLNGAVYFFILMLPVYVVGYFTTEAADASLPASLRLITSLRPQLHAAGLDRVVAAYDPVPSTIYQAADIVDLVLHNPSLETRLVNYPPLLALAQQKEIKAITTNAALQGMIESQAKISDILSHPAIQAILTNAAATGQIRRLLGDNLEDLKEYLNTGKSPRFDGQKILGIWTVDVRACLLLERGNHPELLAKQIAALRTNLVPLIAGFSLAVTPDNQIILRKKEPGSAAPPTPVGLGTWKAAGDSYEIAISDAKPGIVRVAPTTNGTLQMQVPMELSQEAHVLVFNKEM